MTTTRGAGFGVWAVMGVFLCAAVGCGGESGKKAGGNTGGEPSGGAQARGGNGTSGNGVVAAQGGADGSGGALPGAGGATGPGGAGADGGLSSGGNAGGGSLSSGGNAAAGTPQASAGGDGSGGMVADPHLPKPPPNCTALGHDADASLCTYNYACEGTSYYARCERRVSGSWGCQCAANGENHILKELVIRTAPDASPCAAMALACATEPSPGNERSCDRTSEASASDRCTINETCGAKIELADGTTAFTIDRVGVVCVPDSTNRYSCSCVPTFAGTSGFSVDAPSIDGACSAVLGVCETGKLPDTAQAPTCTDQSGSDRIGYCSAYHQCSRTARLSDGVTLTASLHRSIDCDSMPEGRTDGLAPCYCSGDGATLDFAAKTKVDNALCRTALDACIGTTPVEPNGGTASCQMGTMHDRGGNCDAEVICTQPMTIGSLSVTASGYLNLLCQKGTTNSWWCSCQADGKSKIIELGPANSAGEACTAAATRCPKEVQVTFGLQRTPTSPPAPLP